MSADGSAGVISANTGTAFPGAEAVWKGNSGIARHFVKTILPDGIEGGRSLRDVIYGKVNWKALDREGSKVRMRLGSTAVRVEHAGPPDSASAVWVTYLNEGKAYRVKAKGVVMASGQHMNKHVVRDEPDSLTQAMDQFYHGPMLTVNVGIRRGSTCRSIRASRRS